MNTLLIVYDIGVFAKNNMKKLVEGIHADRGISVHAIGGRLRGSPLLLFNLDALPEVEIEAVKALVQEELKP